MHDILIPAPADWEWKRQFVSDVFHELAQPLTALHCMLELALQAEPNAEAQRTALQDGLKLTAEVITAATFIRKRTEADDPGAPVVIPLGWAIKTIADELKPVAEAAGGQILFQPECALRARIDPVRLHEILFYLVDFTLHSVTNGAIRIDASHHNQLAELIVGPDNLDEKKQEAVLVSSRIPRNIVIAERMIKAAGGTLEMLRLDTGLRFRVRLPLAP